MNDTELERLRRKFGGDDEGTSPPEDLLAALKKDIPDAETLKRRNSARGAGLDDHPAAWRLAASVLMIFGFAYIGARIFLESRSAKVATYPPVYSELDRSRAAAAPATAENAPAANQVATAERSDLKSLGYVAQPQAQASGEPHRFAPPSAPTPKPSVQRQQKIAAVEPSDELAESSFDKMNEVKKESGNAAKPAETVAESRAVTAAAPVAAPPPASVAEAAPPQAAGGIAGRAKSDSDAAFAQTRRAAREEAQRDDRIYTVGGDVHAPVLVHDVPVQITRSESRGLRAEVTADFTLRADGSIEDVVLHGDNRHLRGRIVEAIRRREYKPATLDGRAVSVTMRTKVQFEIVGP